MAMYNDKVMEHFMNPHNAGTMENPDAVGSYGSPVCGDMMEISLKIEDNVIVDAKFKTLIFSQNLIKSATTLIKA